MPDYPDREIYRVFLCSPKVKIGYDAKILHSSPRSGKIARKRGYGF